VTAPAQVKFFEVYSPTWFAAIYLLLLVSITGCVLCLAIRNIQARAKEADTPKASTPKPTRCSSKEALSKAGKQASARLDVPQPHQYPPPTATLNVTAYTENLTYMM